MTTRMTAATPVMSPHPDEYVEPYSLPGEGTN